MLERAGDKPIRVASKSIRCRALLEAILRRDERFRGLMTYTLPETLWLAEQGFEDLLLAYPTADAEALGELALRSVANPGGAPIVMVDCVEHLDAIESVLGAGAAPVRVCIDVDAGWWALGGRIKVGPKRSPVHTVEQAVGAGAGDRAAAADRTGRADGLRGADRRGRRPAAGAAPARRRDPLHAAPLRRRAGRAARRRSSPRSREFVELEIVNGGGTGSLELTAAEDGGDRGDRRLGLLRPRPLRPLQPLHASPRRPASRCRSCASPRPASRPRSAAATSPPAAATRRACRPPGCRRASRLDPEEGAGEVQTPLLGDAAARACRSATASTCATPRPASSASASTPSTWSKASEIVDVVPTYRGEGKTFL